MQETKKEQSNNRVPLSGSKAMTEQGTETGPRQTTKQKPTCRLLPWELFGKKGKHDILHIFFL